MRSHLLDTLISKEDSSVTVSVFLALISISHVFGRIDNITERADRNIQASRKDPPDNNPLYSYIGSIWRNTDSVPGIWRGKVRLMSRATDSDIRVHTRIQLLQVVSGKFQGSSASVKGL